MLHENHQNKNHAPHYSMIYFVSTRLTAAKLASDLKDRLLSLPSADCVPTKQQTCEKGKSMVSFCFYSCYTARTEREAKGPSSLEVFQTQLDKAMSDLI